MLGSFLPLSWPDGLSLMKAISPFTAGRLGLQEGVAYRLRFGLARGLDGLDGGQHGVIATEAFGQAREVELALGPFIDIDLGDVGYFRLVQEPRREERARDSSPSPSARDVRSTDRGTNRQS